MLAPRMKLVLLRAFAIHKRRAPLTASTLYQYRCALRRRIDRCFARQSTHPHGLRLQKRPAKIQENLFLMSTVFRTVTNGFRSDWGRDLFAAVRSVVNTGNRYGWSAFQAPERALSPIASLFDPG